MADKKKTNKPKKVKEYHGIVKRNTSSFKKWKNDTINCCFDIDGSYGFQCYDYANLFWLNACKRYVKSKDGSGGVKGGASGIWGARKENNKKNEFKLITKYSDLRKGDIVITNNGKYGHVCFFDQDKPNTTYIKVLGQNQTTAKHCGENPYAKVKDINWNFKKYFLGAFRYRKWIKEPTIKVVNAKEGLKLRKAIGTSAKTIEVMPYKDKVEIIEANAGTKDSYKWSYVKHGKNKGYCASKYLK